MWGWELDPGPLQEKPVLLTPEPSLQLSPFSLPFFSFLNRVYIAEAGLELLIHLLLPTALVTGMHHHASFMQSWGSNPGLQACQASTLSNE